MDSRSRLAILLLAAACSSPRTFESDMAEIVQDYRDDVTAAMGTDAGFLWISVQPSPRSITRAGCVRHEQEAQLFFDPSLEELPVSAWIAHAVHETTHAHVRGMWQTLPRPLEEGLCDMVTLMIVPQSESGMLEDIGHERRFWLAYAQSLGIDGLRELTEKATAAGLSKVPDSWLPEGPVPSHVGQETGESNTE